jgi:hypothetical protein
MLLPREKIIMMPIGGSKLVVSNLGGFKWRKTSYLERFLDISNSEICQALLEVKKCLEKVYQQQAQ